jgi:hypothetical protein
VPYWEFIYGKDISKSFHCDGVSTTLANAVGIHLIGAAVEMMYFKPQLSSLKEGVGGICYIPAKLAEAFPNTTCRNDIMRDTCTDMMTNQLCEQLQLDLKTGRIDKPAMAMWGAAMAPVEKVGPFRLPEAQPRQYKRVRIPGWSSHVVSYEHPKEENMMDFKGSRGGFECMMSKLLEFPVIDFRDDTDEKNQFDDGEDKSITTVSTGDILEKYYRRFGMYPDPYHFVISDKEKQSDATVAKLVFESIGAHHVEVIENDKLHSLNSIGLSAFGDSVDGTDNGGGTGILKALTADVARAAHYIVRLEGLFNDLQTRPRMQGWGGNAVFDASGKLLALQYRGQTKYPDSADKKERETWERFKFIFRSSLVSTVTALDHLVSTHILSAQAITASTFETLKPDHSLRIVLQPHVWNSFNLNFQAGTNLFSPSMLVHRASPYTIEAFGGEGSTGGMSLKNLGDRGKGKIWEKTKILRYKMFSEMYESYQSLKRKGAQREMPFFEDGILLHTTLKRYFRLFTQKFYGENPATCNQNLANDRSIHEFTTSFFRYASGDDESTYDFWPQELRQANSSCTVFTDFLTEVVFVLTGFHAQVGVVTDFFRDTSFAATAWVEGEKQARPKHSMMMMLLAALTASPHHRLNENLVDIYLPGGAIHQPCSAACKQLLKKKQQHENLKAIFQQLYDEMVEVQRIIEVRNQQRVDTGHVEYHGMNPKYLLWGVSV